MSRTGPRVCRCFADAEGRSQIEELPPERHPFLPVPPAPEAFYFKHFPAGTVLDWHPAPRRLVAVGVYGELETGLEDGSWHRFGPGDVRLIEDTQGRGHRLRVVGDTGVLLAVVRLD